MDRRCWIVWTRIEPALGSDAHRKRKPHAIRLRRHDQKAPMAHYAEVEQLEAFIQVNSAQPRRAVPAMAGVSIEYGRASVTKVNLTSDINVSPAKIRGRLRMLL